MLRLVSWMFWACVGWCVAMGYAVWFPNVWQHSCANVPRTVNLGVVVFRAPAPPIVGNKWWPFASAQEAPATQQTASSSWSLFSEPSPQQPPQEQQWQSRFDRYPH